MNLTVNLINYATKLLRIIIIRIGKIKMANGEKPYELVEGKETNTAI